MKFHHTLFWFILLTFNQLTFSRAVSVLNNEEYEVWSSCLGNETYEIVNQPNEGNTTVLITALNSEDTVVDEFSLKLDGDALVWWANQVAIMYDNSDELLQNLTTILTQTEFGARPEYSTLA
ncbi:hypothetical protein DAKH74_039880 [Maudiozyma humilis]|uniref:Uncharacterized protein n=1 Tax=Maudiozyma humilis TaxID=51915 RepID=A0AAV5S250_MAUHU|nr:hypothetical protein DAKH74_039880 [Kazachstania humilis]